MDQGCEEWAFPMILEVILGCKYSGLGDIWSLELLWAKLCSPQNSYVEVLTSLTLECDCI